MSLEKPSTQKQKMSFDQLQDFVNDPALDLPELRRDLSKPENLKWLIQNIGIRNNVPRKIVIRLKKEFIKAMEK